VSAAATNNTVEPRLYDPISFNSEVNGNMGKALGRGDFAGFNFWLSMFSQDVSEQPQGQPHPLDEPERWQRLVGAAQPRPLTLESLQWQRFGLTSVADYKAHQLNDALHPQPLLEQAGPDHLPLHVWQNLDWQTRRRELQRRQAAKSPPREFFEADLGDFVAQSKSFFDDAEGLAEDSLQATAEGVS